jgi:hypothetical protein
MAKERADVGGTCGSCGKVRYLSRKAAKQAARRLHPGADLHVYACGGAYHLGHLPFVVERGQVDRRSHYNARRRTA